MRIRWTVMISYAFPFRFGGLSELACVGVGRLSHSVASAGKHTTLLPLYANLACGNGGLDDS